LESGRRKRARRQSLPERRALYGSTRGLGSEMLARNGTAHRRAGRLVPHDRPTGKAMAGTPDVGAANTWSGKMLPGRMRFAGAELAATAAKMRVPASVPAAKMRRVTASVPAAMSAAAFRLRRRLNGKRGCGQKHDRRGACAHLPHDRLLPCTHL
jgi:hypothetical protein